MTDAESGDTVKLTADIVIPKNVDMLTVDDEKELTLDLNDHYILYTGSDPNDSIITVEDDADLTLTDSSANGTLRYVALSNAYVQDEKKVCRGKRITTSEPAGNHLEVTGGFITGGFGESGAGGAVYINGGNFTMTGGTLCGNIADDDGGGAVTLDDDECSFVLSDNAKIYGNSSGYGGGVYVNAGTFTMDGGTIEKNEAVYNGGGVYVHDGEFIQNSGVITSNNARRSGGGVYVEEASFELKGGSIASNTASLGGGVYNEDYGEFTMSGGSITGNKASSAAGGVYNAGEFMISGASEINGNYAELFIINGKPVFHADTNVCLCVDTEKITVNGELSNLTPIGVSIWDPDGDKNNNYLSGVFAEAAPSYNGGSLKDEDIAHFKSDVKDFSVILNADGEAELNGTAAAPTDDGSKVPVTDPSVVYAAPEDNFAAVAAGSTDGIGGSIKNLTLDFSNVARSDVKPSDLRITAINGSKFTTAAKVKDKDSFRTTGRVKAKYNDADGTVTFTCKGNGTATVTMEDGISYTISFTSDRPRAQKSAKKLKRGSESVTRTITDLFGTHITSGILYISSQKHAQARVSDNSIVIEPTDSDKIKIGYQYLNKKYKITVKVK